MPIYTYTCDACEAQVEAIVPYSQRHDGVIDCPCGSVCGGYNGMEAPAVGREEIFGFRLADGRNIKASLGGSGAPKRRPVTRRASDLG